MKKNNLNRKEVKIFLNTLIISVLLIISEQALSGAQISQNVIVILQLHSVILAVVVIQIVDQQLIQQILIQSISTACSYEKSSFYCPNVQFFKTVKSNNAVGNSASGINCYYYNKSSILTDQKSLTNTQKTEFIVTGSELQPVSKLLDSGYQGYKMNSILTIGGNDKFSFVSSTGSCLSTASANTFGLRFGQNTKIQCNCNSCGTPLIFSDLLGKSIPKFLGVSGNDVIIPSDSAANITKLKLYFIIGKYGSQKVKFIQKVTYSIQNDGSNIRTLLINFVDSDNIKQQQLSASFFPQIPIDMFYPIHIMS